jgi:thiamine-phosphate pyrophosphorylase
MNKLAIPPIYPITDKKLARRRSHLSIVKELVRGGATLIQVRDKSTPPPELLRDLMHTVDFALGKGITLIVNDRCDLVLCSGARGVHLGQDDLPPATARAILGPDRIIGLSTHSLAQVKESSHLPIQYIGFGPIYATSTRQNPSPTVGLQSLVRACKTSPFPVVAIGGIGFKQIKEVRDAGAASIAVISALMTARNLAREMERFLEAAREK